MTVFDRASAQISAAPSGEPFDHVARLAAMVLGTPVASVVLSAKRSSSGPSRAAALHTGARRSPAEQLLCQHVIDFGEKLIIDDARRDPRTVACCLAEPPGALSWAGFPVHGPDGQVVGVLYVADHLPRRWNAGDVEVLAALAHFASGEVALQVAVRHGAASDALAQTLRESLLPTRLPNIPGLQVAARHVAGGGGTEVLGDFYDVFPSVQGSWGMAVGDVCGKGVPAAKSTALARYTLRAEAHRQARPRLILAALNQVLLEWLTDDLRFLTAIYATVRRTPAGASVQISSAGHPLALVHRASGHVQTFGRPGTLLGVLPDPVLYDSCTLLRAGDSLILFTDGVTEARSRAGHDFYGEDRLRDFVTELGDMSAPQIAEAIQQAVLDFGGEDVSDDTVTLVLKVPASVPRQPPGSSGCLCEAGLGAA
jgi:phosphoserine phosphatase RsbU/P